VEPDAVEIRVLGCLIEKQRTTPDAYPLSLNALRLACNQSTNRNPVVDYDEGVIKDALQRTYRRGWTRLTSGHGSRAAKYRHLLDEALGLAPDELALLGVLMLRGAQTPGELKQRSERLHRFADLSAVEGTLARLIERGYVEQLPRQPGQKEERYVQLLGGLEDGGPVGTVGAVAELSTELRAGPVGGEDDSAGEAAEIVSPPPPARSASPVPDPLVERIAALEREVAELRTELSALRDELGA
jgi:uncharacterized protein YceH (UPF0502 family)